MITPLPWKPVVSLVTGEVRIVATDEGGCTVAVMADNTDTKCNLDDAGLIVLAVNNHQLMLDTLKQILIDSEDGGSMDEIDWNRIRLVVASAEGST